MKQSPRRGFTSPLAVESAHGQVRDCLCECVQLTEVWMIETHRNDPQRTAPRLRSDLPQRVVHTAMLELKHCTPVAVPRQVVGAAVHLDATPRRQSLVRGALLIDEAGAGSAVDVADGGTGGLRVRRAHQGDVAREPARARDLDRELGQAVDRLEMEVAELRNQLEKM